MSALLLASLLAVAAPLPAAAQEVHAFNVSTTDPASAIRAFGVQAGIQILASADDLRGKQLNPVSGKISTEEALNDLLAGTGLDHRYVGERAVAVVRNSPETGDAAPSMQYNDATATQKDLSKPVLIAQAEEKPSAKPSGKDQQTVKNAEKPAQKVVQLEEVIVTGSRIPTVAGQQTQPVRSYTRESIERSGQTTVAGFLNTLPDVSLSIGENDFQTFGGVTTVALHGLPVGTTLILLNGRRLEPDTNGIVDISLIPTSALERVEIVPVGAAAIYGADALGGAVNIILRQNPQGVEVNGTFGHADSLNDTRANLAWGKRWERGSISFVGTYQEHGALLGSERAPTSKTHFPAGAPASLLWDECSPGTVYSLNGQNLPGLSSPLAGIPRGISGTPTIQQFAATAGQANQCNVLLTSSFLPATQREGALLSGHYSFGESMDLFTEVLLSHEHQHFPFGLLISASQATLAANNPYNPFGQDVGVSFDYPNIQANSDEEVGTLVRPLIGIRGSLFAAWHYETSAYVSRNSLRDDQTFNDPTSLQAALNSSDPATALNPFTTGAPGTPQLLQSLAASYGTRLTQFVSRIVDWQGVLRGPLLYLPAGPLEAVVGSEYSQENQYTRDTVTLAAPFNLHRSGYAAFTEAHIPLLVEREHPEMGERLALTLAGRYDHTNDYAGKGTWQSGLLWRPTKTIQLRGSYGVSYRAPQLAEIGTGPFFSFHSNGGLVDPFRGGQPVSSRPLQVFGSNSNLAPETGDSRTLGIVYSRQALRGLEASLTYFNLNISKFIGTHDAQTLVNYPGLFPGAVVRGPATPQDQQQGFLGPITQINRTFYNFGDLHVAGFDADLRYTIDTGLGQITPSVALANIYKWQSALTPNSPSISYASQAGGNPGWAPRWKGTAAFNWKRGPLSANLAGRYVGRYKDYQDAVPNSNELGNSWIFDFNTRYEVGQALAGANPWLSATYLALGAVNLFDKQPAFSYGALGVDLSEYDLRGRFVYAQLGLKW